MSSLPMRDAFPREVIVSSARRVKAPAAAVWEVLGDLAGSEFATGAESISIEGQGDGAIRRIFLSGGLCIVERIEGYSAIDMTYAYRIIDYGPLSFTDYLGRVGVAPAGPGQCIATWTSSAQALDGCADDVRARFQQNMEIVFGALQRLFGLA